jgi:hypothetical protein
MIIFDAWIFILLFGGKLACMKPACLAALTILLLTTACVRLASAAQPMPGQNPFTPAADARLCAAADLQTSSSAHEDAGAVILGVTLINASMQPCSLQNPPQVTLLDADQPLDVQLIQAEALQTPPVQAALTIAPGESAILILAWRNSCGAAPKTGPGIRLTLAAGETLNIKTGAPAVPRCDDPNAPSTLTVNPYSYPP